MSTARLGNACVSTDERGRGGLGLDAQRATVVAHVAGARGAGTGFVDVERRRLQLVEP